MVAGGDLGNLARHQRGHGDPTHRRVGEVWWRASSTPEGPVLVRFVPVGRGASTTSDEVEVTAWGEGSAWALGQVPRLLGVHDRLDRIAEDHPLRTHPVVGPLARRLVRPLGRSDLVAEALAPTILEQEVTGAEAFAGIRRLVRRYGTPAPGPAGVADHPAAGMVCTLTAEQWLAVPSWEFVRAGIEPRRGQILQATVARAGALQRIVDRADESGSQTGEVVGQLLDRALRSLLGIGPWTSARVRQAVVGDPDAWSEDDYHVPGFITFALTGVRSSVQPGDSSEALRLLAPFVGHRFRVEQVLAAGSQRPERRGPRRSLPTHFPG